jgi:hypothetical protein
MKFGLWVGFQNKASSLHNKSPIHLKKLKKVQQSRLTAKA